MRGDGGTQARMRAAGRAVEGMKIVGGVLQQTGIFKVTSWQIALFAGPHGTGCYSHPR